MAETKEGVLSVEKRDMEEENQESEKEEDSSEESDGEPLYTVDSLIGRRKRGGRWEYKVRWEGFQAEHDTWEPVENLQMVLDMVKEFDEIEADKEKKRKEDRKLRKLKMEGKLLPGEESPDSEDEYALLKDPFWKQLENGDLDVFQVDMYSKVKCRAIAMSKKDSDGNESEPAPTPEQSAQKGSSRGQGREISKGSCHGKGRGRGKSRLSTDKEEEDSKSSDSVIGHKNKPSKRSKSKCQLRLSTNSPARDITPKNRGRGKHSQGRGRRKRISVPESSSSSLDDSLNENSNQSSVFSSKSGSRNNRRKKCSSVFSSSLISQSAEPVATLSSVLSSSPSVGKSTRCDERVEEPVEELRIIEVADVPLFCKSKENAPSSKANSTSEDIPEEHPVIKFTNIERGKKKKKASRKRKREIELEHSLSKSSVSTSACSSSHSSPSHAHVKSDEDTNYASLAMDESSQEKKLKIDLSGSDSSDGSPLPEIAPPISRKIKTEKKVAPLRIQLPKMVIENLPNADKNRVYFRPPSVSSENERPPIFQTFQEISKPISYSNRDKVAVPQTTPRENVKVKPASCDSPTDIAMPETCQISTDFSRPPLLYPHVDSVKLSTPVAHPVEIITVKVSAVQPVEFTPVSTVGSARCSYSDISVPLVVPAVSSSFKKDTALPPVVSAETVQPDYFGAARKDSGSVSRDICPPRPDYKSSFHSTKYALNNNTILGKENSDRSLIVKSVSKKKEPDSMQPLDSILNSTLFVGDSDRKHGKGSDSDFEIALERMDLTDIEEMCLPLVLSVELSDAEFKQAVVKGESTLLEQAFLANKTYDVNMADANGCTLLMHAVLKGFDDIIVQLLFNGADVQAQQNNGYSALMLAVDNAECSTVSLLLEMGANINMKDIHGETALIKAVKRGDKQILKLLLENGANFTAVTQSGFSALQLAKNHRLADMETTLIDHITRVVSEFEKQIRSTLKGTATLLNTLFPHQCFPLCENDSYTVHFKHVPASLAPGTGFLLFIAHARINSNEVKCRLYGQCAVSSALLNGVPQPSLTQDSNFVLMCHPLLEGRNELVINIKRDMLSKAKLLVCAYKAQLIVNGP